MLYFSPECGHCQLTAHEFMKDAKRFKDVFCVGELSADGRN